MAYCENGHSLASLLPRPFGRGGSPNGDGLESAFAEMRRMGGPLATLVADGITAEMTEDQTVTANWTDNSYEVQFHANGGFCIRNSRRAMEEPLMSDEYG